MDRLIETLELHTRITSGLSWILCFQGQGFRKKQSRHREVYHDVMTVTTMSSCMTSWRSPRRHHAWRHDGHHDVIMHDVMTVTTTSSCMTSWWSPRRHHAWRHDSHHDVIMHDVMTVTTTSSCMTSWRLPRRHHDIVQHLWSYLPE